MFSLRYLRVRWWAWVSGLMSSVEPPHSCARVPCMEDKHARPAPPPPTGTCFAEGERSAHLSSLKSRCDSKFFRPLWDGRSCYSSQDGGQGSGCLMIEEKRSKFILLRALCQVPVAYCWEPLTHHRVTAPEVISSAINLPRLLNPPPSPWLSMSGERDCSSCRHHCSWSRKWREDRGKNIDFLCDGVPATQVLPVKNMYLCMCVQLVGCVFEGSITDYISS